MGRLAGKAARGLNKAIRFLGSSILDVDGPSLSTSMIERHKLHASIASKFFVFKAGSKQTPSENTGWRNNLDFLPPRAPFRMGGESM
jgi:hypothetical protein